MLCVGCAFPVNMRILRNRLLCSHITTAIEHSGDEVRTVACGLCHTQPWGGESAPGFPEFQSARHTVAPLTPFVVWPYLPSYLPRSKSRLPIHNLYFNECSPRTEESLAQRGRVWNPRLPAPRAGTSATVRRHWAKGKATGHRQATPSSQKATL